MRIARYVFHLTKKILPITCIVAVLCLATLPLHAQEASAALELHTPEQIVAKFIETEMRVREALNQHTFKRDVVLQTIGEDGSVTGEYIRNSQFLFDDSGNRIERVEFHPRSTIREMRITREDIQDLAGAQLLGIDILETTKYILTYVGSDSLHGTTTHVLSVCPKMAPNPFRMRERFFRGQIWVDAQTFQIIKIRGRVEPQGKQRFPVFETWRTAVAADLNLPSRTEADDILRFPKRDVNYRIRVRYYDYKRFASTLKVVEVDEADTRP